MTDHDTECHCNPDAVYVPNGWWCCVCGTFREDVGADDLCPRCRATCSPAASVAEPDTPGCWDLSDEEALDVIARTLAQEDWDDVDTFAFVADLVTRTGRSLAAVAVPVPANGGNV